MKKELIEQVSEYLDELRPKLRQLDLTDGYINQGAKMSPPFWEAIREVAGSYAFWDISRYADFPDYCYEMLTANSKRYLAKKIKDHLTEWDCEERSPEEVMEIVLKSLRKVVKRWNKIIQEQLEEYCSNFDDLEELYKEWKELYGKWDEVGLSYPHFEYFVPIWIKWKERMKRNMP